MQKDILATQRGRGWGHRKRGSKMMVRRVAMPKGARKKQGDKGEGLKASNTQKTDTPPLEFAKIRHSLRRN